MCRFPFIVYVCFFFKIAIHSIASVIIGISMDLVGTWSLYYGAVASSIICLISIYIFQRSQVLPQQPMEADHLIEQQQSQQISSLCQPSRESSGGILPLYRLLQETFASFYSITFFFAFFTLSIGMSVVENMIFLFYQSTLGSSNTM
jgi:hypothetical protein